MAFLVARSQGSEWRAVYDDFGASTQYLLLQHKHAHVRFAGLLVRLSVLVVLCQTAVGARAVQCL